MFCWEAMHLVTGPEYHPYRETPVARPLLHYVFCGIAVVSQTIAATSPLLSIKMAYCNPKTGLGEGYGRKSSPLGSIAEHRMEYYRQSRYSGRLRQCNRWAFQKTWEGCGNILDSFRGFQENSEKISRKCSPNQEMVRWEDFGPRDLSNLPQTWPTLARTLSPLFMFPCRR